jgi:enoyl-CoA hydratase
MTDATLIIERLGAVCLLTVNRPDKRNALDGPTRRAFIEALEACRSDRDIHVAVLTGAGDKAFIAGADITEFATRTPAEQYRASRLPSVYQAADEFPKPLIAMINGLCLGGGNELAMACDVRIAAEGARFGQPEINLGIIPGGGGTQRLPRLVGLGTAFKLIYSGQMVDAAEALRIGLVDEVVPLADLRTHTLGLAATIATKSPVALRLAKEAIRASVRAPLDEGLRHEQGLFALTFATQDMKEGVAAFLEKRQPRFTGE